MEFSAAASALELVDFSLNECARRDDDFIACRYGSGDLGINIITAVKVAGLNRLREHQGDSSTGGNGDDGGFRHGVGGGNCVLGVLCVGLRR